MSIDTYIYVIVYLFMEELYQQMVKWLVEQPKQRQKRSTRKRPKVSPEKKKQIAAFCFAY